jgi:hypothetical protein
MQSKSVVVASRGQAASPWPAAPASGHPWPPFSPASGAPWQNEALGRDESHCPATLREPSTSLNSSQKTLELPSPRGHTKVCRHRPGASEPDDYTPLASGRSERTDALCPRDVGSTPLPLWRIYRDQQTAHKSGGPVRSSSCTPLVRRSTISRTGWFDSTRLSEKRSA